MVLSTAALVLFLLPLLYAGSSLEDEAAVPPAGYNDQQLAGTDYPMAAAVSEMDLYSPDDFLKRVVVAETQDIGLVLYDDQSFRDDILSYYTNITGSEEIADAILRNAYKNRIPFTLAFALSWAESRFNPKAVNRNAVTIDRGLFQLNSSSFPRMSIADFFDVEKNAAAGLKYLRGCLDAGGTPIIAIAMYNAGQYRVNSRGAPRITLTHISNILEYQQQLERDFDRYISRYGKIRTDKESGKNLIPVSSGSGIKKKRLL